MKVADLDTWAARLVDAGWDGSPRFDHVAITAPDLDEVLGSYRDQLGFWGVGEPDRLGLRAIGVDTSIEPTVGPGDIPVY
jgi:hypothetical protein